MNSHNEFNFFLNTELNETGFFTYGGEDPISNKVIHCSYSNNTGRSEIRANFYVGINPDEYKELIIKFLTELEKCYDDFGANNKFFTDKHDSELNPNKISINSIAIWTHDRDIDIESISKMILPMNFKITTKDMTSMRIYIIHLSKPMYCDFTNIRVHDESEHALSFD